MLQDQKDVFISYAREDFAVVTKIVNSLTNRGVSVWHDCADIAPGASFDSAIRKGLSSSHYLLLIVSEASMASKWVQTEWETKHRDELAQCEVIVIPALHGIGIERLPKALEGKRVLWLDRDFEGEIAALVELVRQRRRNLSVSRITETGVISTLASQIAESIQAPDRVISSNILNRLERSDADMAGRIRLILREVEHAAEGVRSNVKTALNSGIALDLDLIPALTAMENSSNAFAEKISRIGQQSIEAELILKDLIDELKHHANFYS